MGYYPTKAADNIYCQCRKEAAKFNDSLNSREGAAEQLNVSVSTLSDYELGSQNRCRLKRWCGWRTCITRRS